MREGNLAWIERMKHRIKLTVNDIYAVYISPYHVGPIARRPAAKEIQTMLQEKVVKPANTKFVSPTVFSYLKDGSLSFWVYYHKPNEMTVRNFVSTAKDGWLCLFLCTSLDILNVRSQLQTLADCDWQTHQILNGVYESTWPLLVFANAIELENRSGDISTSDGCHIFVNKMARSSDVPRPHRSLFEERHQLQVAIVTGIHTASGSRSRINAEKISVFAEKTNYLRHFTRPGRLVLFKVTTEAVGELTDHTNQTVLGAFMSFCILVCRFVPNLSKVAAPFG